jgi:hypothetical protein
MVSVVGSKIFGPERNTDKANNTPKTIKNLENNFFVDLSPYVWVNALKYGNN